MRGKLTPMPPFECFSFFNLTKKEKHSNKPHSNLGVYIRG